MKRYLHLLLLGLLLHPLLQAQNGTSPESVLAMMKKVADWQLQTWDTAGMRAPAYDWTNGACYAGLVALYQASGDSAYAQALYKIGEGLSWNTGPRRTMADDYCVAQMFCQLYAHYKNPVMIAAFRAQADSIAQMPHNESLLWKNDIALREWAWCDALFMGPPALAYLYTATGDQKYLDLADTLWWKTTDYLYDPTENLYWRDSRYFTQREANGKKIFWSRGNGWVMGGLVRMMDNMPAKYPDRSRFTRLYKNMAEKIASIQQPDGTWHTALLDPEAYPVKETSGTGFYCYALAWGINNGLLKYKKYYPVVAKAWWALTSAVHPDGKLGFVQQIGDRPAATDYNSTQVYGVGAFLLAGSEMMKLLSQHK